METIIEATIAEGGQVVIDRAVRDRIGLTLGARLNFVVNDDGSVALRRLRRMFSRGTLIIAFPSATFAPIRAAGD